MTACPPLPMIDPARLEAPARHGETLVAPAADSLAELARRGGPRLDAHDAPLLDDTLRGHRRRLRAALAGGADRPVIVIGHQPGFEHAGVWAKHVVADRLARAVGGVAINLVVDNDAPGRTTLAVPVQQDGRLEVRPVRYAVLPAGDPYEHIPRQTTEEIARFEGALRDALGERFEGTQLPVFLEGFAARSDARDWVDQAVAGRRAIESRYGVDLIDHRIGDVWGGPMQADLILRADRFFDAYNRALSRYRIENRVRGRQRPIPDLTRHGDAVELPMWVYQPRGRRMRLFARNEGERVVLLAEQQPIGAPARRALRDTDAARAALADLAPWRLRPRALTLTLWARLLLADLFIHGIGGAKYDRITDEIIRDYYNVDPPPIACVSATLHLDLPHEPVTEQSVREIDRRERDVRFNPQRHVRGSNGIAELLDARSAAVARSDTLRKESPDDRAARRRAFEDIRRASEAILDARPELLEDARAERDRLTAALHRTRIATDRAYFFGLHTTEGIQTLLDALPSVEDM